MVTLNSVTEDGVMESQYAKSKAGDDAPAFFSILVFQTTQTPELNRCCKVKH